MSKRSNEQKNREYQTPRNSSWVHHPPAEAIQAYREGFAFQAAGRLAEAEAAFQRAIELDAHFADAYNDLGVCYYLQRRFHEAFTVCRKALEIEPQHDGALSNLGAVSASLGNLEQAIDYFRRSLALNPNNPETQGNLERAQRELELRRILSVGDDAGPASHDSPAKQPTISLCLIARDEEAHLPKLFDSVKEAVDEIVLVDTGSTDSTIRIARSHGARVIRFPWHDDFAAAKNEVLRHATADWILHLDADMYFEPGQAALIRRAVSSGHADAYYIIVRSPSAGSVGRSELVQHPWLFRNRPDIRFEGAVHEQLIPAMDRAGITPARTDITVEHVGYADSNERKAKLVRNMRIVKQRFEAGEDDPLLRYYLAQSHLMLKEPEEAIEMLQPVPDAPDINWRLRLNTYAALVEAHLQAGDYAQATAAARKATELFPHDRLAWVAAARASYEAGDYDTALGCFRNALARGALDVDGVIMYFEDGLLEAGIADCYRKMGKPAEAMAHYRKALELGYDRVDVQIYLAEVYQASGQLADAEAALRQATAQMPDHPEPHRRLGLLLAETFRLDEAIRELETAVRAGGGDEEVLKCLEELYGRVGSNGRLEQVCRQAVEAGHATTAVLGRLGLTVIEEPGSRGAGEPGSRGARGPGGGHERRQAQILAERGTELVHAGQYRRALREFEEALSLDPKLPGVRTNLGICHYELGDYAQAVKAYEAEIAISPDDDRLHNNLGTLHAALGNFAEAARYYRRALELNPFNAGARANLELAERDLQQFQMLRLNQASSESSLEPLLAEMDESVGKGPSISLCLIARNEEAHLSKLLSSVHAAVDEIILVDTGSTDRTVEIARSYGARVIEFPWRDDFAAAKNVALRHATSDWVLHLDADMSLPQGHAHRIRRAVASGRARAYLLQIRSPAYGSPGLYEAVFHPWLFENRPEIRFEGTIHERILPSLLAQGMMPMRTDIVVDHVGYTDPGLLKEKVQRNLNLLEKRRAEGDDDLSLPFYLAQAYLGLGRYAEAVAELGRFIRRPAEVRVLLPTAYCHLVSAHMAAGDWAPGLEVAREACRLFPHLRYPHYLAAAASLHLGDAEQARTWASQAKLLGDQPTTESFVLHIDDAGVEALLGDCAQVLGHWEEAIGHYAAALRQGLDTEPVRRALSKACHTLGAINLQTGRPAAAIQFLEQAVALSPGVAGPFNDLGFAHLQLGDYQPAAVAFSEAIRLNPESGQAYFNLGLALEKLGQREDAVMCIQRALELDPGLRL
jgi:tetratricopeptide (TPR) repeat protein